MAGKEGAKSRHNSEYYLRLILKKYFMFSSDLFLKSDISNKLRIFVGIESYICWRLQAFDPRALREQGLWAQNAQFSWSEILNK